MTLMPGQEPDGLGGLTREAFYGNEDNEQKRDAAVEEFQLTLESKTSLLAKSYALQNKLAEYFKRKRGAGEIVVDNNEEVELQYKSSMDKVDELNVKLKQIASDCETDLDRYKERCEDKKVTVDGDYERVLQKKQSVSQTCIVPRSGRPVTSKELNIIEDQERKKDDELEKARLENIKQKNKLEKNTRLLEEKEQVINGLNLIDFEQLKIENQTYHEKIDERNEDLLKLHKKIERTVQILTHMREKLEFVTQENQGHNDELDKAESGLQVKRDEMNRLKHQRERLRNGSAKLQRNMGLYGKEDLLFDFEEQIDKTEEMKGALETLKSSHASLKAENADLASKIDRVKVKSAA